MKELMKCGHSANATKDGKPFCVICMCGEVAEKPSLAGRKAKCYCGHITDSSYDLPFFKHEPEHEYDSYYCGHDGWN